MALILHFGRGALVRPGTLGCVAVSQEMDFPKLPSSLACSGGAVRHEAKCNMGSVVGGNHREVNDLENTALVFIHIHACFLSYLQQCFEASRAAAPGIRDISKSCESEADLGDQLPAELGVVGDPGDLLGHVLRPGLIRFQRNGGENLTCTLLQASQAARAVLD